MADWLCLQVRHPEDRHLKGSARPLPVDFGLYIFETVGLVVIERCTSPSSRLFLIFLGHL
jgi:hypothetical protein